MPSSPPRTLGRVVALLTLTGVGVAACGSGSSDPQRDTGTDVAFKGCDQVKCSGELDGAAYEIVLPQKWNGTLLLYSHGYRSTDPAPPDFAPVSTAAEPAPGWAGGSKDVGQMLLDQGFALAGSAYATNGWAVADGVKAGEGLEKFFSDNVATPNRTYVWGDSLGGLITAVLAEKHPDWVSGVAPFCGALAGPNDNFDLALDVAYAVKTLVYPQLKLTGYASFDEAVQNWEGAVKALTATGSDLTNGVPKILLIAALVDASAKTQDQDGSTIQSKVTALAESVATALGFATFGRYDVEQRVGGNPSDNTQTDYATRVSPAERSLIDAVAPGSVDRLLAELAKGQRVAADPAARRAFADTGTPTGDLQDPTITLHTSADPLVIVQNETVYGQEVAASKTRTADLLQLYTVPPATYPPNPGAPYGAGHCNFTPQSRVAVIDLLDRWVKDGVYPAPQAVEQAMGSGSGYSALYRPGPWPATS